MLANVKNMIIFDLNSKQLLGRELRQTAVTGGKTSNEFVIRHNWNVSSDIANALNWKPVQ